MKRIIYILILLLVGFAAIAQETPPAGLKAINSQFYIHLPDSSIWQQKGSPYNWHRVAKYSDLFGAGGIFKLKADSIANDGYVTHGYFNSHGLYTANNGITLTGHNFGLGGALTGTTAVTFTNFGFGLGDLSTQKAFVIIDPTTSAVSMRGASVTSASNLTISKAGFTFLNIHGGSNQMAISADTSSGMSVTDQQFNFGLKYNADYSTNGKLNDRWIPDWGAVKSVTSSISSVDSLNTLYNSGTFSNLSDFVSPGTYSVVDGKLRVAPTQAGLIQTLNATAVDSYNMTILYKAVNGQTSAGGLRFGLASLNTTQAGYHAAVFFDEVNRKLNTYDYVTGLTTTGTAVLPSYTAGDELIITVKSIGFGYNITLNDITTGQSINYTAVSKYDNPSLTTPYATTSSPAIFGTANGVAYDVTFIRYSTPYHFGGNLFIGDSITRGRAATPASNRYAILLGGQIDAGPSDKSSEVLKRVGEIVAIKPRVAYIMIGVNDAQNSIPFATWASNVQQVVSILTKNNIKCVLLAPTPQNAFDMHTYRDSLQKWYPRNFIDTYTPLLGSGFSLNASYNSGDNVHPNTAGQALIASTISGNSLYSLLSYDQVLNPNIIVKNVAPIGVTPGSFDPLTNFTINASGQITNATPTNFISRLLNYNPTITATSGTGVGGFNKPTVVAAANGDNLSANDIAPTFLNSSFTGTQNFLQRWISSAGTVIRSTLNGSGQQSWFINTDGAGKGTGSEAGTIAYGAPGGTLPGMLITNTSGARAQMRLFSAAGASSGALSWGANGSNTGTDLMVLYPTGHLTINRTGDLGQAIQANGRIMATQALTGVAALDSIVVHDNTSKEFKTIGAGAYIVNQLSSPQVANLYINGTANAANIIATNSITTQGSTPVVAFTQTGGTLPTNSRNAQIVVRSGLPSFELLNDAFAGATPYMQVVRNAAMPLNVSFPNGVISATQNKVLNDTSYKTNAFQSYVSPANVTLGIRPGFSFNADGSYGSYFYMNALNDYKVRQSDGTTISFMANPMTTAADLITATTGGVSQRLGIGSNGQVLTVSGGVPTWSTPSTGFTNPMTTQNDMIVGGTSGTPNRLAIGTTGQVLTSNGSSTAPSWQTPSGGGSGIQRLTSFYTNVVAGTTETDLYDYTIPANTLSANGSMIEGQYNGEYSTTGPTDLAWINVYFAGQQILAATSTNGILSLTVRIFKTGTSTARADCILVSATNGGFVNSRTFQTTTDLTGLDFTTTNPLLTKGYNTVGTLTYKDGIVKINP